jgi:hypothetical protein
VGLLFFWGVLTDDQVALGKAMRDTAERLGLLDRALVILVNEYFRPLSAFRRSYKAVIRRQLDVLQSSRLSNVRTPTHSSLSGHER